MICGSIPALRPLLSLYRGEKSSKRRPHPQYTPHYEMMGLPKVPAPIFSTSSRKLASQDHSTGSSDSFRQSRLGPGEIRRTFEVEVKQDVSRGQDGYKSSQHDRQYGYV